MKPMWAMAFALLFVSSAEAAELRCSLSQYRQSSTGKCIAKDSALGRRYYRGGKRAARRAHRRAKHIAPFPARIEPPADPELWEAPVAPAIPPDPPAGFCGRFYFGKCDRLPPVNLTPR